MINSFKKLFQILLKEEKQELFIISIFLLVGMFMEVFGLGIVFPFILSILEPKKLNNIQLIDQIKEYFQISNDKNFTLILLSLLVATYIVKTLFMVSLAFKQNKFVSTLTANISNRLFQSYLNKPIEFHKNNSSSILIKNIQVEVSYLNSYCMSLITIVIEFSLAASIFLTLIFIEPLGALAVTIYFLILSGVYFQMVKPKILKWGDERVNLIEKSSKTLMEGITSIRELILFNAISRYINSFTEINNTLIPIKTKSGTFKQIPRLFLELFAIIGIVIFIFFLLVNEFDTTYAVSIIGVFIAATFRLIPSVNRVLTALQNIKFYTPSVDIIHKEIFKFKDENINIVNKTKINFKSKLELDKIYFKHIKTENKWNLENISLQIYKGDFIGIKGQSGSGKSTLIDLLVGLNIPDKGNLIIDGKINNLSNPNWRKEIGYVSQDIILIDDTIINNIILGNSDQNINYDKVYSCIEKAGLTKFIKSLNKGLDTIIGERGVKLSGGQKQRIGIARALYKNPKILLLDEATSSLDNMTESKIMKSINKLKGEITMIIVAHRLSTIEKCNSIYELKSNKLRKVR